MKEETIEIDQSGGVEKNEYAKGSPENPWRVYCDGVFDLFHIGHARALKQSKEIEENVYLIVGVSGDEETHRIKGKTVLNEEQRSESVRHCRYTGEVICPCPWVVTLAFLDEHNIDFIVHGQDISYDENGEDCYKDMKRLGRFRTIQRTEGISTSDIIKTIVCDYDEYLRRNLKRGYTRKQLNISFIKEQQIKVGDKIKKYKDISTKFIKGWKGKSEELVSGFLTKFNKIEPNIRNWFSSSDDSSHTNDQDDEEKDTSHSDDKNNNKDKEENNN